MAYLRTRVHRENIAEKPWNSVNAVHRVESYRKVHAPDRQEDIDFCINCPLPAKRCSGNGGCYKGKSDGAIHVRKTRKPGAIFDIERYRRARENGMNDEQVAAVFGVTKKTVKRWKKKYETEI